MAGPAPSQVESFDALAHKPSSLPLAVAGMAAVAAAAVHIAVNGYAFGGCTVKPLVTSLSGDHANILPWVYWYQDRSLFPHDLQIQSGASYATVFWRAVAWIGLFIPVEYAFIALHVVALIGIYAALFQIGRLLGGNRWAGVAACVLFIVARDAPAGEATHDPALYTRMAALPLVLAALYGALRALPIATFGCLLVAAAVHLLTAIYAAPVILAMWAFNSDVSRRTRAVWLGGCAIAGIIAVVLAVTVGDVSFGRPSEAWLNLQRENNVMHLFPSRWAPTVWHDAGWAAAFLVGPVIACTTPVLRRFAIVVILTCGVFALAGWFFSVTRPSMFILQLQLLRGIKIGMIFACIAGAAWLFRNPRSVCATVAFLCVFAWLAQMDTVFAGLLACALVACLVPQLRSIQPARGITLAVAGISMLAGGIVLVRGTIETVDQPGGGIVRRYRPPLEFPWRADPSPWIDVQKWIAQNTPADAFFITSPSLEGFRTHSKRSEWADWKQGTLSLFNERFGVEWRSRLVRIAGRSGDPRAHIDLFKSYNGLSANEFHALAAEYGLTHAVTMTPVAGLTNKYTNKVFWVYALR